MDFVDEEDIAFVETGEQPGQIAGLLDDRTTSCLEGFATGICNDIRQRSLAQTGRTGKQDVVQRLATAGGGSDHDLQLLLDLALAGETGKLLRAQGAIELVLAGIQFSGNETFFWHLLQLTTDH